MGIEKMPQNYGEEGAPEEENISMDAMVEQEKEVEDKEKLPENIIELPKDSENAELLRKKLDEYTERLSEGTSMNDPLFPYKYRLLSHLLRMGSINKESMKEEEKKNEEPNQRHTWFNEAAFNEAWDVIEDYAKTGGANNVGGTGLGASFGESMEWEAGDKQEEQ